MREPQTVMWSGVPTRANQEVGTDESLRRRECNSAAMAALEVLGRAAPAIVMLRADGSVAWQNESATMLVGELDLRSRVRFLQGRPPRLYRITSCDDRPLLAMKIALDADDDDPDGVVSVVVVTVENREEVPQPSLLEALFDLTPAEARVAVSICSGRTIAEIAEGQCVAGSTVRSQLKSVFNKTGVHRQADLVRQIMSLQTILVSPDL